MRLCACVRLKSDSKQPAPLVRRYKRQMSRVGDLLTVARIERLNQPFTSPKAMRGKTGETPLRCLLPNGSWFLKLFQYLGKAIIKLKSPIRDGPKAIYSHCWSDILFNLRNEKHIWMF